MKDQGKLYLIPNVLADNTAQRVISPQVKEVIKHTTFFWVEDLRTARRDVSTFKLGINIEELELVLLEKSAKEHPIKDLMRPTGDAKDDGIISEAGCPGIADPGALAVSYAH